MTASDLEDRVALVTGCGRENGLGYQIARGLAERGAKVALTDVEDRGARNANEPPAEQDAGLGLEALVERLEAEGVDAIALRGDIAADGVPAELVQAAVSTWGRLDILVNNAAAPQGDDRLPFEEVPDAALTLHTNVNLIGTFRMCREAVPRMRANAFGRIINISSIYGRRGAAQAVVYSMTKAGIIGMTRSLAVEVASYGITANSICPGMVHTARSMSSMRRAGVADESAWLDVGGLIPVGRRAVPEDIVSSVLYLAHPNASYVTAQELTIDGGLLGF